MWMAACSAPPPTTAQTDEPPLTATPQETSDPTGITFFSWAEYMPPAVLDQFEAETGIEVDYVTYDSQQEAVAAIRAGDVSFDVAVIASDWAPTLRDEGLLAKLDRALLPNFNYVAPQFRNLYFDPDNDYTVPYLWGTTGLVVRTDLVQTPITQWADLWDQPEGAKILARPIPSELFSAALLAEGHSLNSEEPAELAAALARLQVLKPSLVFAPVETEDALRPLLDGETGIMIGWSGDALAARAINPNVAYVLPVEGAPAWVDNFVISAASTHQVEAAALIDFVLRPAISAAISEAYFYPSANEAAARFVSDTIRTDPLLFPTAEEMGRLRLYIPHTTEIEQLYEQLWQEFQATE